MKQKGKFALIFESEPWGDNLLLAPVRGIWIFFCLLILPGILTIAGLSSLYLSLVPMLAALLACIGTPVQLGMKKLSIKDICWTVLAYILMMSLIILLSPYWEALLEHYGIETAQQQEALNEVENSSGSLTPVLFICMCILTPIVEEILFRRIIYGGFRNICPAWLAVIVTSLIFSAVHFFVKGFVSLFIMGVMFNLIFLFRKNLWASILLHAIVNSAAFLFTLKG